LFSLGFVIITTKILSANQINEIVALSIYERSTCYLTWAMPPSS